MDFSKFIKKFFDKKLQNNKNAKYVKITFSKIAVENHQRSMEILRDKIIEENNIALIERVLPCIVSLENTFWGYLDEKPTRDTTEDKCDTCVFCKDTFYLEKLPTEVKCEYGCKLDDAKCQKTYYNTKWLASDFEDCQP